MGRLFKEFLSGSKIYSCSTCKAHLAHRDQIISKSFQGRQGRAYLFDKCVIVALGPREERLLMTGLHIVCDLVCIDCQTVLGWKYEEAYEESQKYKVGKFIIEKARMTKENGTWPDQPNN